MSTFSKLKQQREKASYAGNAAKDTLPDDAVRTSMSPMDVDRPEHLMVEVQPGSMRQTSYHPEGLYGSLPRNLEIRVHMDGTGNGRGIYNLRHRNPGKSLIDSGKSAP